MWCADTGVFKKETRERDKRCPRLGKFWDKTRFQSQDIVLPQPHQRGSHYRIRFVGVTLPVLPAWKVREQVGAGIALRAIAIEFERGSSDFSVTMEKSLGSCRSRALRAHDSVRAITYGNQDFLPVVTSSRRNFSRFNVTWYRAHVFPRKSTPYHGKTIRSSLVGEKYIRPRLAPFQIRRPTK